MCHENVLAYSYDWEINVHKWNIWLEYLLYKGWNTLNICKYLTCTCVDGLLVKTEIFKSQGPGGHLPRMHPTHQILCPKCINSVCIRMTRAPPCCDRWYCDAIPAQDE